MKAFAAFLFLFIVTATVAWSEGREEASSRRGKYLADIGTIIPADEIFEEASISTLDFLYPDPDGDFGANLYSGHRQISNRGQEEIILIGMQGKRTAIEDLAPLNIAVVVDVGSTMAEQEWADRVRESLQMLLETIRERDILSITVIDDTIVTLLPSTTVAGTELRNSLIEAVQAYTPNTEIDPAKADLNAGLRRGYEEVRKNYNSGKINRVLFLSDGIGEAEGIFELAEAYRQMDIYISTIGFGDNFNLDLMRSLAKQGGGSSRFISDKDVMQEVFGHGLGRLIAPAAHDIAVEVELLHGIKAVNTWGYDHEIDGQIIRYYLPSIHYSDYETIVIQVRVPKQNIAGERVIARLKVAYTDLDGNRAEMKSSELTVHFVSIENPVDGFTDATVLKAGTMLHYAQALKKIGNAYYKAQEIRDSKDIYEESIRGFIEMSNGMKKELSNARRRLDYIGFEDEINVLEKYLAILGYELDYEDPKITLLMRDEDVEPASGDRDLVESLNNLFREMGLDMKNRKKGRIAVSGFAFNDGRQAGLIDLLNNIGQAYLFGLSEYSIVDMETFNAVLEELELSLADLNKTTLAIEVGKLLSVDYILTGSIIELSTSVALFGRIINVETAAVESASQIIVPRNDDINALLAENRPFAESLEPQSINVEIVEIDIDDIFPVFYKYYDENPAGKIIVRNNEDSSISDFNVSFFVEE